MSSWLKSTHLACTCCITGEVQAGLADVITDHPYNNVPENVFTKLGVNLHQRPDHPLGILKDAIYSYFDQRLPGVFQKFDDLYPVVSTKAVSSTSTIIVRGTLPASSYNLHSNRVNTAIMLSRHSQAENVQMSGS